MPTPHPIVGYIYIELNASGSNTISDGLFSENRQR